MFVSLHGQQVGDLYTFPDSTQGIVYYLLPDGSGGWVVALDDVVPNTSPFGDVTIPYSLFVQMNPVAGQNYKMDTAGYQNTQFILQYCQNASNCMVNNVDVNHGWYLPAFNQLSRLYSQLPYIESALNIFGITLSESHLYMSSTLFSSNNYYAVSFDNGSSPTPNFLIPIKARAVRTFIYPPALYDTSLTYHWNIGSSQPYFTAWPQHTTTYSVTATNESGCSATASQTVFVAENYPQEYYDVACQHHGYEGYGFSISADQTSSPGTFNFTRTITLDGCTSVVNLHLTVLPWDPPIPQTATSCGPYTWNGVTYYESGVYKQTFTADGRPCDDTLILNLTIIPPDTTYLAESACDTYTLNGITYSYSGIYTQILTGSGNGCDSIVILDLTVHHSQHSTVDTTAYDRLVWNNILYTESGTYTFEYLNQYGCDSIIQFNVNILHLDTVRVDSTVCDNALPFEWNGVLFADAGTQTVTLPSYLGYDSVVVMTLHVNSTATNYVTQTTCDSLSWGGVNYTHSGFYTQTFTNQFGCDSTVTLHLIVNPSVTSTSSVTVCDSYEWAGETYTQSGVYERTFTNRFGCDSVVTLTLTVNPSSADTVETTACDSYDWAGETYTQSGIYERTFTNHFGCDSVVTMTLTVHHSDLVQVDTLVCPQSLPVTVRGFTFAGEGMQTVTVPNIHGCDSTTTVHVSVSDTTTLSSAITACDSYSWYGTAYTESGTYEHVAINAAGCPYTRKLALTVHYSDTTYVDSTCCQNQLPLSWNGRVFSAAGTQSRVLANQGGCDSLVVMTVNVVAVGFSMFDTTVCGQFEWAGSVYTQSGTFMKQFPSVSGCDSMVVAHVTVLSPPVTLFDTVVCADQMPLTWHGINFEQADTLTFTYTSSLNCDSTVVLRLRTATADTVVLAQSACDVFEWEGEEYYEDTTLTGHFVNRYGCDSLVTLHLTVNPTVSGLVEATVCGSYIWNHETFTQSGDYTRVFATVAGCDSTVTLHLTVYPTVSELVEATTCEDSLPYLWNGLTFYEAGTKLITLQTVDGCDSTVTLHLTVNPTASELVEATVCEDELPYLWNGVVFDSAGIQSVALQTVNGCDSTVTMHLTVYPLVAELVEVTACDSYLWNNETFTESGDYTRVFTSVNGCDSTVTLHLTVNLSAAEHVEATACDSYVWNNETFTESGDYTRVFTTVNGCDSTVTLHLTVNPSVAEFVEATACDSYLWNNETFTESGDYTRAFTTVNGCDSTVTLHLTVKPSVASTSSVTVCEDELPYIWNGVTFNEAGTQLITLQTVDGCDSIVTMTLHISSLYQQTVTRTICQDELPYTWNGVIFYNAGTQNVTLQTINGCDSVITMTLQVFSIYQPTEQRTICQDELPYTWNGVTFQNAGTQSVTLQTVDGCDSIVTMVLHVSSIFQQTEQRTVCQDELPYIWNGRTFNAAGTQSITMQTANGCDSTITMTLLVNPTKASASSATVCSDELPYLWNGVTFDSAATQTVTLQTVAGCDSVVTMTLMVNPTAASTSSTTVCDSYIWGDEIFTESGDYTRTFATTKGCDSVVTLHLTVNPSVAEHVEVTACDHYLWNGETFDESGVYESTFETAAGCDSVVTLHLTVIDTALQIITLTEDFCEGMSAELVAVTEMTDYLWNTDEEMPNITVTRPGIYSVTASQGGCRATAKYTVEGCDFRLWLPNAISPSKSDGLNDVFCLPQRVQSMVNDFEISIFNRWGEQVFYSTDKGFRWDGSLNGKTAVNAVYNYVIRCTVIGGKPYRFTGSVTVL